jgi:hypothetical protein
MAKKKADSEPKELEHLKSDRSVEKFDGTLDGIALTIKAPEETAAGVRRRLIDLLRHDEEMEKFIEVADTLIKRRGASYPSLDLIAHKSGMEHAVVVGAIAKAAHRYGYDYCRIIAAANSPRVFSTLANRAAHPEGHQDRALFLRATGHLPTSGGTNISVQANSIARSEAIAISATEPLASKLPNFEVSMKENLRAARTIDVLAEKC